MAEEEQKTQEEEKKAEPQVAEKERKEEPKQKKAEKKGKKIRTGKKHSSVKIYNLYEIKDNKIERKRSPCPRCGPGTFMANHKGRKYCGRCGYTLFSPEK